MRITHGSSGETKETLAGILPQISAIAMNRYRKRQKLMVCLDPRTCALDITCQMHSRLPRMLICSREKGAPPVIGNRLRRYFQKIGVGPLSSTLTIVGAARTVS
jgi:hypothetical protein